MRGRYDVVLTTYEMLMGHADRPVLASKRYKVVVVVRMCCIRDTNADLRVFQCAGRGTPHQARRLQASVATQAGFGASPPAADWCDAFLSQPPT